MHDVSHGMLTPIPVQVVPVTVTIESSEGLKMPELHMLIGVPGSGKSTLAKRNEHEGNIIVSSDDIREELTGDAGDVSQDKEVWPLFYSRIREYLSEGLDVIADATHLQPFTWDNLIYETHEQHPKRFAHIFDTPHEVSRQRNRERDRVVPEDVMVRMCAQFDLHVSSIALEARRFIVVRHSLETESV